MPTEDSKANKLARCKGKIVVVGSATGLRGQSRSSALFLINSFSRESNRCDFQVHGAHRSLR